MDQERITVVVADDHPLMAEALAQIVESDDGLELLGVCSDGEAALAAIRAGAPDVAVLDVSLPLLDGLALASHVRAADLDTRMLFVSGTDDAQTIERCNAAGGQGFVSKSDDKGALLRAIGEVANGGRAFPNRAGGRFARGASSLGRDILSPQERRVLALAADGLSTAAIAAELYVSHTTVKTHLRHAAEKLGVRGKTAASVKALRSGLIR